MILAVSKQFTSLSSDFGYMTCWDWLRWLLIYFLCHQVDTNITFFSYQGDLIEYEFGQILHISTMAGSNPKKLSFLFCIKISMCEKYMYHILSQFLQSLSCLWYLEIKFSSIYTSRLKKNFCFEIPPFFWSNSQW